MDDQIPPPLELVAGHTCDNYVALIDSIDHRLAQVRHWQDEAIFIAITTAQINSRVNFDAALHDLASNAVAIMQCVARIDINKNGANSFVISVLVQHPNTGLFDVFLFANTLNVLFYSFKLETITDNAYIWHASTKT